MELNKKYWILQVVYEICAGLSTIYSLVLVMQWTHKEEHRYRGKRTCLGHLK